MKKEILKAFLTIAVASSASTAFATQTTITSVGTTIGSQSFKPSNNVTVGVVATTNAWSAQSGHTNGDRRFGASYDDPKIYWTSSTQPATDVSVTNSTDTYTTWTSL